MVALSTPRFSARFRCNSPRSSLRFRRWSPTYQSLHGRTEPEGGERSPARLSSRDRSRELPSPRRYAITIPVKGLDCISALKALGEENRLRMLRLLSTKQLGVGEISERLNVSS